MSTTPTLNGQVIGQAHYATRALLERAVAPLGLSFGHVLALNVLADGAVDPARLVHRITSTLKTDEQAVREVIAHLVDADLARVDDGVPEPQLRLTDAGHATQRRVGATIADTTTRLYGDIPTDEARVVAQVLTLVTQRANAELAALPA
ncbi:hypothetical protein ACLQ28_20820 [Micromonospora sp. DT201]|uniref:hypothetical protein n=1 Tax=Micromonospora sp. DT201 TaxID=3393442 RepID=UPI003CE88EAA